MKTSTSRTVFVNGTVATSIGGLAGDGQQSEPTAMAIDGASIVAFGSAAVNWANRHSATIVDLHGGCLLPAFGDGHCHPILAGRETQGPQLRECAAVEDIVATVADWAEAHPDSAWIVGGSYDATLIEGSRFDARWLDAACAERPIMLHAWDYHTVWVNSAALDIAGITAQTREPDKGRILRRDDGSALGTLQEWEAVDLVRRHVPRPRTQDTVDAIEAATHRYAQAGVTWIQDAWVEPDMVGPYLAAAAENRLGCRVNLAFRIDPANWQAQVHQVSKLRREVEAIGSQMLTATTVKFFVDGIIENHTAWLLEPYSDRPGERGIANWDDMALGQAAQVYDRLGFQLHLHSIGDAANRSALDAIEYVVDVNGARDRRPVVAHVHVLHPADVTRFAELGVIANFQPLWAQMDRAMVDFEIPHIGAERASWQHSIGQVRRTGAMVSFGSDWPVTCHHPLPGVQTAVTRQTDDGLPENGFRPEERLDPAAALAGYTSGVAYQAFAENVRGRLFPGAQADVVWLSADPRVVSSRSIEAITIRGTWLAGTPTFLEAP